MSNELPELDYITRPFADAAATTLAPHFPASDTQDHADMVSDAGRVVAGAVLRKLAEQMRPGWENDSDWPTPDQLDMIADDLDGGVSGV